VVKLSYDLDGPGWANCRLEIENQSLSLSASYLSDALGDLVAATSSILRGEKRALASFAEEPGEFRWELDLLGRDRVRVRVFWDGVRWEEAPHDPSTPLIDGECTVHELGAAVLGELSRLQRELGESGYVKEWIRHPFPRSGMLELANLLDSRQS
jgi:hypothetical protein